MFNLLKLSKSDYLQSREDYTTKQADKYTKENIQEFFGVDIVKNNNGKFTIHKDGKVLFEEQEN